MKRNGIIAAIVVMLVLVAGALALRVRAKDECENALARAAEARLSGHWDLSQKALEPYPACATSDAGRLERTRRLLAQARINDAMKALEEESKRQPQVAEVWANLGYTLALSGKDREAIDALKRADAISPNDPTVTQHLAQVRARQDSATARAAGLK
jgi:predicted Zn-dependent protease